MRKMNKNKGFSFVEVLLALGIFSIVGLCIYSTLFNAIRLNAKSKYQNGAYREMWYSLRLITKELEGMVAYDFSGSYKDEEEKKAFTGLKDELSFCCATDKGVKVIRYYLQKPERTYIHRTVIGKTYKKNVNTTFNRRRREVQLNYLMRQEIDFMDYLQDKEWKAYEKQAEIIASDIKENSLEILYGYQVSEESAQVDWKDEWDLIEIPSHIRIKLTFVSKNEKGVQQLIPVQKDIYNPMGVLGMLE